MADHLVRPVVLAVGLLIAASACSSTDESTQDADTSTEDTTSSTTEASTTTTFEATTTTLSELALAEAEVEEVVVGWWTFLLDTSEKGSAEAQREFTTGLLLQRNAEFIDGLTSDGLILRITEPSPIDIAEVKVDLDSGAAEVTACEGSTGTLFDAETQEVVQADDPEDTAISTFQLQLLDGQWKISEFLPSALTDTPITCEITQ